MTGHRWTLPRRGIRERRVDRTLRLAKRASATFRNDPESHSSPALPPQPEGFWARWIRALANLEGWQGGSKTM